MRERGTEVVLFHELLAETLADRDARAWLLERKLRPEEVTTIFSRELIAWMTEMPADELATRLTGGVMASELPGEMGTIVQRAMRLNESLMKLKEHVTRLINKHATRLKERGSQCQHMTHLTLLNLIKMNV
jgi:arginine deiminase